MSNDETAPVSGSRWEPVAPAQPAATAPDTAQAPPPATTAYAPAPPRRNRGGLILAGGALGVALVAGAGGFALGHATADDGRDGPGRMGFQNGFPGGGPQGTFPGPGGQGQGQPPQGFDPRGDDDDQGQLPDDGATQGSSTS